MANIVLKNINKYYKSDVHAVIDANLEIIDGEFIVFVGPSGCGKSTTLRMICGLEEISSGELYMGDRIVNDLSPKDRDIAIVFQNYALYSHMTAYHNMAFSLVLQRYDSNEIHKRVIETAKMLDVVDILNRKPKQLSGGQKQRIALGRAIVRKPQVFLLDEPLSNLDAKLRDSTRKWLKKLHHSIGITFVYVTHDQVEAMTMADRIVVMNEGVIQQVGTPQEIYDKPNNIFVGKFIGTPPMNFMNGRLDEEGCFVYDQFHIKLHQEDYKQLIKQGYKDKEIVMGCRAEDMHALKEKIQEFQDSTITLTIDIKEFLGANTIIQGKINKNKLVVSIDANIPVQMHENITLAININKVHFYDVETTNIIL